MYTRQLIRTLACLAFLVMLAASAQAQACPFGTCTVGTAGPDVLNGTAGNDCICGLGSNDVIRGLGGNDDLYGNAGSDCLFGDAQNDDAYGGNGFDTVHGNADNDDVYGDNGNDCVFGDAANDDVYGGAGTDVCRTGEFYSSCENTSGIYFCAKVIIVEPGGSYPGPGDTVPINP